MPVQRITSQEFGKLENPGVLSEQLVWKDNAPDAQATITRVTMQPGAEQSRHRHDSSEQIWLIISGTATILLDNEETAEMFTGEIYKTPPGEVHGILNDGTEPLIYIAVTTPPQDFSAAYEVRNLKR